MGKSKILPSKSGNKKKDHTEGTYETWVEYICPVKGKVRQKVKVKKLKTAATNFIHTVGSSDSIMNSADKEDSGSGVGNTEQDIE